jgi:hypothetical protein
VAFVKHTAHIASCNLENAHMYIPFARHFAIHELLYDELLHSRDRKRFS